MPSQRDLTMTRLLDEAGHKLGDTVKWPESEACKKEADNAIKALRKFVKEDNYPDLIRYMIASQVAANLFSECVNRHVDFKNYKMAWIKLTELFE